MIENLDNLLRHLFMTRIAELNDEERIRFQPPDEQWRQHVANLSGNALNVYLMDLRENRVLRSKERIREIQNGMVNEVPVPRRVDCHYLITAWSPAVVSPAVEPTVDEHALLYAVTVTLTNNEPLVPRKVYAPDPLPAGFPDLIADAEVPTSLLPVEGFTKYAEFWATMGVNYRWKPAVYLVVTLPVALKKEFAGSMVTTSITKYRSSSSTKIAETWIQIGGSVLVGTPAQPVVGAWVRIEDSGGTPLTTTATDSEGHFTFAGLQLGTYNVRVRAQGFAETTQTIQVPTPTGNYDVQLS